MMKKLLLNEAYISELLIDNKITIIDGGARGELFSPFNQVNKDILQVIRFEPDADAEIDNSSNDIVVSKALWDKSGEIEVNIALEPSTSSVYPFNRALQKYIDPFYDVRKAQKVVKVKAISLNDFIGSHGITRLDFIKLDIHGAEYEVLAGADQVLNSTLGLLIESWIIPIHKGQKTRAAVELLAYDHDFYVFEENKRSEWGRMPTKFFKRQPVAVDTLFFKDPILNEHLLTEEEAVKLIGMAELFGHIGYAWQLTEYIAEKEILKNGLKDKILSHLNIHHLPKLKDKIFLRLSDLASNYFNISAFR